MKNECHHEEEALREWFQRTELKLSSS